MSAENRAVYKTLQRQHAEDIANWRGFCIRDEHRATKPSPTIVTMHVRFHASLRFSIQVYLQVDCVDQDSAHVPCKWESQNRHDMPDDSYIRQKLMGCVIYGSPNLLRYYVALPFMSSGANYTISVLLDALQYADLRADELRLQVDGAGDNVNHAMHVTCLLLVQYGIFKSVFFNRLPTGYVSPISGVSADLNRHSHGIVDALFAVFTVLFFWHTHNPGPP